MSINLQPGIRKVKEKKELVLYNIYQDIIT